MPEKCPRNQVIKSKNHIWNGITTLELAKYIESLLELPTIPHKIVHLFSTNSISKYKLLEYISVVYKKTCELKPYETPSQVNTTLQSVSESLIQKTIEQQIIELWEFNDHQDYAHSTGKDLLNLP